jgi:hypothetical protein
VLLVAVVCTAAAVHEFSPDVNLSCSNKHTEYISASVALHMQALQCIEGNAALADLVCSCDLLKTAKNWAS